MGIIAGCYARKSNDEADKDAEAKSVARQLDHARQYAARKGWVFDDQHVYVDDGVSGTEFVRRPDLNRLLATIQDRSCKLTHLIVSEQSRLGRDTVRTLALLQALGDAGVAVWSYLEDRELSLADELGEAEQFLKSWASASEARKTAQRVRDQKRRKAEAGQTTGGRVLGYQTSGGTRTVIPSEAAIVQKIFGLRAQGFGYYRIARQLEADGIQTPRGRGKWSTASLGSMLRNELYTGALIWGRTKSVKRRGTSKSIASPENVITRHDETLRIISPELWQAVQDVNKTAAEGCWQDEHGRLKAKPTASKFLLTPFLQCECGSAMHVRYSKRGDYYFCTRRHLHGKSACPSATRLPVAMAERAIVYAFEEALSGQVVMTKLHEVLAEHQARQVDPEPLKREAAELRTQIERLVNALAGGQDIPDITTAISSRRAKLEAIEARLASTAVVEAVDVEGFRTDVEAALTDLKAHLRKNPSTGQAVLRKILPTRVTFKRSTKPGVLWDFSFESNYSKVLEDVGLGAVKAALIAGLGFTSNSYEAPRRAGWSRR